MTHLPNAISLGRLLSVPVVVLLLLKNMMFPAFWVFVVASLSDAIDGYLARKFNFKTALGVFLDPLADKILLISVFVVMGYLEQIPFFLVALVVLRDIWIFSAVMHLRRRLGDDLGTPIFISKVHTLLQMTFITLTLAKLAFHLSIHEHFFLSLVYAVATTTVLSTIEYVKIWRKLLVKK